MLYAAASWGVPVSGLELHMPAHAQRGLANTAAAECTVLQEAERVMATFVEHLHLPVTHVDDAQRTLARLKAGATPRHHMCCTWTKQACLPACTACVTRPKLWC